MCSIRSFSSLYHVIIFSVAAVDGLECGALECDANSVTLSPPLAATKLPIPTHPTDIKRNFSQLFQAFLFILSILVLLFIHFLSRFCSTQPPQFIRRRWRRRRQRQQHQNGWYILSVHRQHGERMMLYFIFYNSCYAHCHSLLAAYEKRHRQHA